MRGYLLIVTSGILFFIIAAVTVLHLMSARALTQQYHLHQSYQAVLDFLSIKGVVARLIDTNEPQIILPPDLSSNYSLSNQSQPDGSVDFLITNIENGRLATFNVMSNQSQATISGVDLSQVSVAPNQLAGVQITSPQTTQLVALRTA